MINDLSLAGFVAGAAAHGRITFGDMRRLQRDHLPHGIETRDQAEMLAALAAKVEHADRSWRMWLAAALTAFAAKSAKDGAAAREETIAWLAHLSETPGLARRISRKIAKQLRGEAETALAAEAASGTAIPSQEPTVPSAPQSSEPSDAERRRRTRAAKRSRIIVPRRPAKRIRSRSKGETMPFATMPSLWGCAELMGEPQLQVPLAAQFR
jgi:hypothetical protein